MVKWILLSAILLTGCKVYDAPNGGYFPYHWGAPPEIQTKDYVVLPEDYGHGSSTLRNWIQLNIERDNLKRRLNQNQLKLNDFILKQ